MGKNVMDIPASKVFEYPQLCDYCGKPLPKRHVIHKNISQDPPVHHFCSRECKNAWCAAQVEKEN